MIIAFGQRAQSILNLEAGIIRRDQRITSLTNESIFSRQENKAVHGRQKAAIEAMLETNEDLSNQMLAAATRASAANDRAVLAERALVAVGSELAAVSKERASVQERLDIVSGEADEAEKELAQFQEQGRGFIANVHADASEIAQEVELAGSELVDLYAYVESLKIPAKTRQVILAGLSAAGTILQGVHQHSTGLAHAFNPERLQAEADAAEAQEQKDAEQAAAAGRAFLNMITQGAGWFGIDFADDGEVDATVRGWSAEHAATDAIPGVKDRNVAL